MSGRRSTLIIDFGGVLTTDLWESVRACARREGLPDDALLNLLRNDLRQLFAALERGEVSQAHFEQQLAAAAGLSPERLLSRMCADIRPDEVMLAAVDKLRGTGIKVGILSNSWGTGPWGDGYFDPYAGYELDSRADAIVLSDTVALRKPEPAIFELMLRRLDAAAADAVFVDDVAANLPAARAMGMHTIHHVATPHTVVKLIHVFGADLHASAPPRC